MFVDKLFLISSSYQEQYKKTQYFITIEGIISTLSLFIALYS